MNGLGLGRSGIMTTSRPTAFYYLLSFIVKFEEGYLFGKHYYSENHDWLLQIE